jgi:hypothetical protein
MQTQYNEIINSFVDKYGLSRGQVVAEIEKTFSTMLSRWYKSGTVVLFGDGYLQALHYAKQSGISVQNQLDFLSLRGWNTLQRALDRNFTKIACLHEVARYKRLEHEPRWGDIIRKNTDGFLVEIEIEKGLAIIAECPLNRVGVHERHLMAVGQRRAFHLRRVDSVKLRGITRVKVVVDRVSKNLVTALLREQLGAATEITLYCAKRYVGHKSFVQAGGFLPKQVILTVSRELHEHIQVTVGKIAGKKS